MRSNNYLNLSSNLIAQIITAALNFLSVPLLIKCIGSAGYGYLTIVLAFQSLILVCDFGIIQSYIRKISIEDTHYQIEERISIERSIFFIYSCLIFVIVFSLMVFSRQIANLIGLNAVEIKFDYLWIYSVLTIATRYTTPWITAVHTARRDVFKLNIINILFTFNRAIIIPYAVILNKLSINEFMIYYACSNIIELIIILIITNFIFRTFKFSEIKFYLKQFLDLAKVGLPIFYSMILWIISTQIDKFLLASHYGVEQFGKQVLVITICSPLLLISAPIYSFYLPKLSSIKSDISVNHEIIKLSSILSIVVICPSIIICIYGLEIIYYWMPYVDVTNLSLFALRCYALGNTISVINGLVYLIKYRNGETNSHFLMSLISTSILLVLFIVLIPKFGIEGAAFSWSLINFTLFICYLIPNLLKNEINLIDWNYKIFTIPVVLGSLLLFLR